MWLWPCGAESAHLSINGSIDIVLPEGDDARGEMLLGWQGFGFLLIPNFLSMIGLLLGPCPLNCH